MKKYTTKELKAIIDNLNYHKNKIKLTKVDYHTIYNLILKNQSYFNKRNQYTKYKVNINYAIIQRVINDYLQSIEFNTIKFNYEFLKDIHNMSLEEIKKVINYKY